MKVISSIFIISMLFGMLYGQWPGEIQVTNTPEKEYMHDNNWSIATATNQSTHQEWTHLVWTKKLAGGRSEVYYVDILGLMSPRALTNYPTGAAYHPSIAASGQNVHVVYTVSTAYGGWGDIYYIRSVNGGIAWSAPTLINNNNFHWGQYPSIAVSGNVVHVTWSDNPDLEGYNREIYYRRSIDNGATWTEPVQRLTNITDLGREAMMPCVAVFANYVHVTWTSDSITDWEIYYKHSVNSGQTWSSPTVRISDNNTSSSQEPSIAAQGSHVYVAWKDFRNGRTDVYFDHSNNNGTSWQWDPDNLVSTEDAELSQNPSVAANQNFVFIVYQDTKNTSNPEHNELWCARSANQGLNWTEEQVTANNTHSQEPAIATNASYVHVTWMEIQDPVNNNDIFYNKKAFVTPPNNVVSPDDPLTAQQLSTTSIYLTGQLPDAEPVTIRLFNSLGQLVKKTMHVPAGKNMSFIWQIDDIPKGVYFLRMSQPSGWQSSTSVVIAK